MDFIDDLFGPETPMDRLATANRIEERAWIRELTEMREKRKMSQEQVGALMGIGQSAVARIEAAERDLRLSTLFRYALAVNAKVHHHVTPAEDDVVVTCLTATLPTPADFAPDEPVSDVNWRLTSSTITPSRAS